MARRRPLLFVAVVLLCAAEWHLVQAYKKASKMSSPTHSDCIFDYKEMAQDSIFYSYTKNINGFAAHVEEEVASQISKHPDVVTVLESKMLKLHTTRSWDFMDLERDGQILPDSIWKHAKFGQDVIIANLDSGVWPESNSFTDDAMGEVPQRWKGSCQDDVKYAVPCNKKLIGAKYFNKDMLLNNPAVVDANWTRDTEGHGTHTLSIAGGSFVPRASLFGYANGTAKGGAPRARVAAYKVCWSGECAAADVLAGFEAAIHDGADVISVSFGQDAPLADVQSLFHEPVTLGSLHATTQGISVVCSAGNSGPYDDTVVNGAPWVTTVAASTVDRDFPNVITLGNSVHMKGMSLESTTLHSNQLYPMVHARHAGRANCSPYDAANCGMGTLDPAKVKGKIVVCVRGGDIPRVTKGMAVLNAGGVGMILANGRMDGDDIVADPHVLPATMITYSEAVALHNYMTSTGSPVANISPSTTEVGVKNSPSIAGFSSRGPSGTLPSVLKPDIAAPGVDILAAFTEYVSPTELASDKRRSEYAILSGTSMACPHISGVIGLLKAARPEWSPAAMRSAIMTTARTQDNTGAPMRDHDGKEADAFAYGAGNVHPNRAIDPGLVYDAAPEDYFTFLCSMGFPTGDMKRLSAGKFACPAKVPSKEDLNYPSIVVPSLRGTQTVTRRLKNVGRPAKYLASWRAPIGITMEVKPTVLEFSKVGEEKAFNVTVTSQKDKLGMGYMFGRLVWTDGTHYVRSPVVVNALA
ncbi:Subtilisin-like protease SBT5.3 [Dichanthelium oligosanthes]|uniref:Subtilisin-like protease SBT5.3 n=1 Tax=Dichanthelium oligosanthes TaxID=888268 RepID=A0A1E5VV85_9POAL|nr:Subtilisin-like protease SBT5.3 [Dichanthelium oligosanthes]